MSAWRSPIIETITPNQDGTTRFTFTTTEEGSTRQKYLSQTLSTENLTKEQLLLVPGDPFKGIYMQAE